jgi:hypothetical protein
MSETAEEKAKRLGRIYIPDVPQTTNSPEAAAELLRGVDPLLVGDTPLGRQTIEAPAGQVMAQSAEASAAVQAVLDEARARGLEVVGDEVVAHGASQADILRLARLVAAGILRTRTVGDQLKIGRVPETRGARARRLERKRKRHLKRKGRRS